MRSLDEVREWHLRIKVKMAARDILCASEHYDTVRFRIELEDQTLAIPFDKIPSSLNKHSNDGAPQDFYHRLLCAKRLEYGI